MIQGALEFVAHVVASLILACVLLPICLAVATPIILLKAPIWPGRIRSDYAAVYRWWDKWAIFIVP
jgi:hypothetical protein